MDPVRLRLRFRSSDTQNERRQHAFVFELFKTKSDILPFDRA